MPNWTVIITIVCSCIITIVSVLTFLKNATREIKDEISRINDRIDRHLDGHP